MAPTLHSFRLVLALSLLSWSARAQQPATAPSAAPVNSTAPPLAQPSAPVTGPVGQAPREIIGQTYSIELVSGTSLLGVLTAIGPDELTFQTKELGLLTVKRVNIKQLNLLTADQALRGYDYQGNGNRMFFGPTARNLRRGEGTVQTIDIFLLGVNYGITDNISMGALFTWVPQAGTDNFFALTPKVSFPVKERLHFGAGALVVLQQGSNFTLTYANTTYGSADNNVTAGIGYAFVGGSYVNTPVFMVGGAGRLSRRVSLLNETYILNLRDSYSYSHETFIGGIAGVRLSGQRLSGSLGLMYGISNRSDPGYGYGYGGNSGSDAGAIPFAEATYRFGRTKQ